MKNKAYCQECEHFKQVEKKEDIEGVYYFCKNCYKTKDTWLEEKKIKVSCDKMNQNNDCIFFLSKKI